MGSKTKRLIEVLEETIPFLRENGEDHYADWMMKGKRLLERSDFRGIAHILSAFGGMGSFNDCVLRSADVEQANAVNRRLQELQNMIFDLANSIRREVDRSEQ